MDYRLSVIIVNYRTPAHVIDCLGSLLPELGSIKAKVIIVDNDSGDNSVELIESWIGENDAAGLTQLVRSSSNEGFASGNNKGINTLVAENYLLLNSDTIVRPGAIAKLLETADRFPEAGIVSPGLEWADGSAQVSCFRFESPISELLRVAQTGILDKLLCRYVVPLSIRDSVSHPDWTSFACVMIRDAVIKDVGLLDHGYFMYYEDVEFCWRAKQAGWTIASNPEARVVHLRGGSSAVKENIGQKKRLPRFYYESRSRYFYQTCGWTGLVAANLLWCVGRIISKSRQFLGKKDPVVDDDQWKDIWINCLQPLESYTHPDASRCD